MPRRQDIPPARIVKDGDGDGWRPVSDVLDEIASELNLLSESRLNPHVFLERRDMLVRRLRRLAGRYRLGDDVRIADTTYRGRGFAGPDKSRPRTAEPGPSPRSRDRRG